VEALVASFDKDIVQDDFLVVQHDLALIYLHIDD
jgi:hypothetical protein